MYANIIFVDNDEMMTELRIILEREGCTAAIDYLAQWDYGNESEYDIVKRLSELPSEKRYTATRNGREYVLIEHPLYITLYRRVSI